MIHFFQDAERIAQRNRQIIAELRRKSGDDLAPCVAKVLRLAPQILEAIGHCGKAAHLGDGREGDVDFAVSHVLYSPRHEQP